MLYITVRCHWCDTVLNVHTQTEDKSDDEKDSFYEEPEHVFDQFQKYPMESREREYFQTYSWE
jgi:hypothetical protein